MCALSLINKQTSPLLVNTIGSYKTPLSYLLTASEHNRFLQDITPLALRTTVVRENTTDGDNKQTKKQTRRHKERSASIHGKGVSRIASVRAPTS